MKKASYGSFALWSGRRNRGRGLEGAPRVIIRKGADDGFDWEGEGEEEDGGAGARLYCDNVVSTARYSLWSFLPRSLFEQFRRVANLYFLLISVLMLLGKYTKLFDSPLTPWSTLIVLVLVLLVSIGKEGVEDRKRHAADWETNRRLVDRMRDAGAGAGTGADALFEAVQWQHVAVGDVLRVESGSELPADLVLLATSEPSGLAYIETANIDGETNLKAKSSVREDSTASPGGHLASLCGSAEDLAGLGWRLECEQPNSIIHHFSGTLALRGREQAPIDASSLLLRGSSLKNTRWAVGVVVYTGRETKIVMNSRKTPSKLSSIERSMNSLIYLIFAAQVLISVISLVFFIIWKRTFYDLLDYLCYSAADSSNPLYREGCTEDGDSSDGGYFFTFFILYNNFLPISLYVTVEICNYFQAYFIEKDIELYDEVSNMPALARTSNMNSDLGMVEYVFSDKTGTLTDNVMRFRRCSVAGVVYGDAPHVSIDALAGTGGALQARKSIVGRPLSEISHRVQDLEAPPSPLVDFVTIMAVCHTVVCDGITGALQSESPDEEALVGAARQLGWAFTGRQPGTVTLRHVGGEELPVASPGPGPVPLAAASKAPPSLAPTATTSAPPPPPPVSLQHHPVDAAPAPALALALPLELPDVDSSAFAHSAQQLPVAYSEHAPAPEAASSGDAAPRAPRTVLSFEILATVPFDSTRKRMSVVVRRPDGSVCAFVKGADNVIYDRSQRGAASAEQKRVLNRHLEVFAGDGLRTLVLAKKELSAAQYDEFAAKWRAVEKAVLGRDELIREAAELLESDLTIVGASAIEDKLQDGVPQTILDLGNAGVKVWVLTGDKMETAINIGYSARLLGPQMVLVRLQDRGEDGASLKRKLRSLVSQFVRLTQNRGDMLRVWRTMRDSIRWALRRGGLRGGSSSASGKKTAYYGAARAAGVESDAESASLLEAERDLLLEPPLQSPSVDQLTSDHLALIVDGETLLKIFGDAESEKLFLAVATICKSVIACRVSPEQKRLMVRLVKRGVYPRPVTLSIGDGANDVAMIQEAQIGVGICGKEGRQAVNSSDFAIAQFRFLKRLMLVHGRTDYRRTCKVVLYSFYKNIVLTLVLFAFTFFSGYSGQSLFDDYVYSSYNVILAAPVVAFGVFDVDISPETLLKYSFLYVSGREGLDMNVAVLLKEMLQAILDAALLFFVPYYCYYDPADTWTGTAPSFGRDNAGKSSGIWVFGTTVFTLMVLAMFLRAAMLTYTWTYITHMCFWGSLALYLAFLYAYQHLLAVSYNFYGVADQMVAQPTFFWLCLLVPAGSMLIELSYRLAKRELRPTIVDVSIEFDARQGHAKRGGLLFEEGDGDDGGGGGDGSGGLAPGWGGGGDDRTKRGGRAPRGESVPVSSRDDDDEDEESDDGILRGRIRSSEEEEAGYQSGGSVGSVASEALEAQLRYSSVVSAKRGKFPLDWQSVRALKAGLSQHEQEALGLHEGAPRPEDYYNYDHVSSEGYGPGAGIEHGRMRRAASRQRLRDGSGRV